MRSSPRNNRARRGRGLSIAEVMISLTISSFLLVAVAAAYSASADAVEMNDKFFRATQAGRVTMNQLLTEIRRADYILVAPTKDSIIVTRPQVNRMPEEKSREYKYDPNTRKITLQIFFERPDLTVYSSPAYSLASNVEWAEFATPDRIQDVTGQWLDVRVPVTIDVKIGTNSVRLSGSSSPRRVAQG
jgi:type II secretory pathway pseudopilin PulG